MAYSLAHDQQHWETRAKEARAMADRIQDPDVKRAMRDIAENYDKIAKRAEAKEAHVPMPPSSGLTRDDA